MAEMQVVGRVSELWRYPVKSMQGEQVRSLDLSPSGVAGDRAYGLVDTSTGRLLSAKAVPPLFEARSRTVDGVVVITLPDGREVSADDAGSGAVLSDWLGRDVELRRSGGGSGDESIEFELRFDPADDDGELFAWPARAGSFLDSAPIHLLTTGSLGAMATARPQTAWDVRRFRPNVLVDTGSTDGFVEDGWIGADVAFGSSGPGSTGPTGAGPTISVGKACGRCAMPVRSQGALLSPGGPAGPDRPPLDRDVGVFRALTAEHDNNLGVYADVTTAGTVTLGDEVQASA